MYFNANGEQVSRRRWQEMYQALKNRQELIKAGFTRRDLLRMGLIGATGMLAAKSGLSSRVYASWGSGSCRTGSTGCGTGCMRGAGAGRCIAKSSSAAMAQPSRELKKAPLEKRDNLP